MPTIIEITDFNDSALDVYVRLTGSQLRNKLEPEKGIFIAESPTVIEVAMNAGCVPVVPKTVSVPSGLPAVTVLVYIAVT